jgi:transcriptional regulator with XRE-family HTH domain
MSTSKPSASIAKCFGLELRRARKGAGLTQQVLAERANIDPVFVSFLENGHRQPSLTVLLALERALGLGAGTLARRVGKHLTRGIAEMKGSASIAKRKTQRI